MAILNNLYGTRNRKLGQNIRTMIRSRIKSFSYAFNGIVQFFRTGVNAKIQLVAGMATIALGFWFDINLTEWMLVFLCIGMVIGMELMNTALEAMADVLHPEHHPKIGLVKDLAAGAVLITAIIAACIGGIIFLPRMLPI